MKRGWNLPLQYSFFIFIAILSTQIMSRKVPSSTSCNHFVLIHGACHGAWSWYKVATLLRSSGHNVTALDLAASGIDPRQENTLTSISEYFWPLIEFMDALPSDERVVLVGHSLGGLAVAKAMEDFPEKISLAVFVSASMIGPRLNISTLNQESSKSEGFGLDTRYIYNDGPDKPATALLLGPLFLASTFYKRSPAEDLTLATTLLRPQRVFSKEDLSKVLVLSDKKYGRVKRVYIKSEEDWASGSNVEQWILERNPPDDYVEIEGSDHMIMLSKPFDLSGQLQHFARKYS